MIELKDVSVDLSRRRIVSGVGFGAPAGQVTAIVKATILLASSLRMSVLAEGVERQDQADFLRAEGCTEIQGFLYGRPQRSPADVDDIDLPATAPTTLRAVDRGLAVATKGKSVAAA